MQMEDIRLVIAAEIERKREEINRLQQALANLDAAALGVSSGGSVPTSREYAELGTLEATKKFLAEMGKPLGTRDIADALLARGLRTKSRNYVASVYATMGTRRTCSSGRSTGSGF